jgi:mono/diheme cytochrome c family protein
MYSIDANVFMNWVLGLTLATAALLLAVTLGLSLIGGKKSGPVMSYLYMLTTLFGIFALVVVVLGVRGQKSGNRPWHFFLDMKYQPKYTSQGQSRFFADGRSNRLPPEGTIPFDGTDYFSDAGYHSGPNPMFLKADRRYFYGIANADAKMKDKDGVEMLAKPVWKDGKLDGEGYYVNHIPEQAVEVAGGWRPLIERGRYQFDVHCAVCHGASGRGGAADAAYGTVGAFNLSVPPSSIVADIIQAQPDGQLFNVITNGVRNMPAYAHQVKVQDRWAIVAYIRVLQYATGEPK